MSPDEPPILAERDGDIVWLTLNRPERLNAINLAMRDALWAQLCMLRDDPTVRVAVLQGAGPRAFSAGADITDFGTAPSYLAARESRRERDLWGLMLSLEIPLIAALHGFAYGAGLEMSMCCDLRIAAEDVSLGLPEVKLGYIPSAGGTQLISRHVPLSLALRMVTTGEPIGADEALAAGLVQRVVRPEALTAAVQQYATSLARHEPASLRATKRAAVQGLELPLAEGLALERRLSASVAGAA